MPRHVLPSLFDNLHCSLKERPSTHHPQCPWHWLLIPEDTKVCWPQSETGPVSLCVCSVAVWEYTGSAGSNAKDQHGQRLFRAAIFSQLQLTFAQPAIPLQACISDFWVTKTTTATWEWISAPRCEEGSQDLMYPCYVVGKTVPAWSMEVCVPVNTWLQIPVSLGGGMCLHI